MNCEQTVCERIYNLAMDFIAEDDNDDFKARCVNFINAFAVEHAVGEYESVTNLSDPFPLPQRFSTACALYIAAALVENENREMAIRLTDKYKE